MSDCGHPPRVVQVNKTGSDGKTYPTAQRQPCQCGANKSKAGSK